MFTGDMPRGVDAALPSTPPENQVLADREIM